METVSQFCTMWQTLFTDVKSVSNWNDLDLERIIEWARCCEKAISEELRLSGHDEINDDDVAAFNAAVVERFPNLPPSSSYAHDLAHASHHIVKALIQNPYLSDDLVNYLVKILSKSDSSLANDVVTSVEDCVFQKTVVEMLLSSEAFAHSEPPLLPFKARANITAKRLICVWKLLPPSFSENEGNSRQKAVKAVLHQQLDNAPPIVCLLLLKEVAEITGLNECVYKHTLSQQQLSFGLDGKNASEILATISSKYPAFFTAYLLYLLRQLHQVEGSSQEDTKTQELLASLKMKLTDLSFSESKIYNAVRRLLIERRDRTLCDRQDIYDNLLQHISAHCQKPFFLKGSFGNTFTN